MSIIMDIEDKFCEDFDKYIARDKAYRKAEENLHNFIVENISDEDVRKELENLAETFDSSIRKVTFETGVKFGARLMAELLKED